MDHKHTLEQGRDDGLSHCLVCGGGEGALPTMCPRRRLEHFELDLIHAGQLDFDRGPMHFSPVWWTPLAPPAPIATTPNKE